MHLGVVTPPFWLQLTANVLLKALGTKCNRLETASNAWLESALQKYKEPPLPSSLSKLPFIYYCSSVLSRPLLKLQSIQSLRQQA